jgi:Ca-activated chloride channel family protein
MIENFHFLRPAWLLALAAAAALAWVVSHHEDMRMKWRHAIAPHLLDRLLLDRRHTQRIRPVHLTILLLVLGAIAAAGPTWRHERSPFVEDTAPLAIAIDLSRTMDATDISPSRLERVKLKVRDLLALRQGARSAIFVYAGSAHMVLPLTDDAKLVQTYVDSLATRIMPVAGKNTVKALVAVDAALARETVPGTILFITDGVEPTAFDALARHAGHNEIMVLGVGTAEGGPVKTGKDEFLADAAGARVFAKLDVDALRRLKSQAGIQLATITSDDQDVQWINRRAQVHLQQAQTEANTRWEDVGWWLVIPIALLSALWFRRGWTIRWTAAILLTALVLPQPRAQAAEWKLADAWLTPDQQGRLAFERGDFDAAAGLFVDPMWKGVSFYRGGKYDEAVDAFARLDTAESWYDQGDALAQLGKLPQAVGSFQQALKKRPDWPEAAANLKRLQDALAATKKEDDQESNERASKPDQIVFDDKASKGRRGRVDIGQQTAEMWMRNIQVTPTDLLARRFSIEAGERRP